MVNLLDTRINSRWRLLVEGREIVIDPPIFLIGRSTECQLRLGGGLVSRRHARLSCTAEGLTIEDLGSRNGVLVNKRTIEEPTRLRHGDIVGIGLSSIEVVDAIVLDHPPTLSTLPPAPAPPGQADVDGALLPTVVANLEVLSAREREVLRLIVLGHTQREISERLHLSVKTIESHRANISEKLGCKTRAELVFYAITAGLLRGQMDPSR